MSYQKYFANLNLKNGRLYLIIFFVLIVVVIGFKIFNPSKKDVLLRSSIVGVETAVSQKQEIRDIRVFTGTLKALRQYDAASKIGGQVKEIAVNLGDCVNHGDIIARLDNDEYLQQLAQAKAELDVAKASLAEFESIFEASSRDYNRKKSLRAKNVVSSNELENAETDLKIKQARVKLAQAQVKQKEATLRTAEVRLDYTVVKADWQSSENEICRYVAERHVDQNSTISANNPIVTIVDLSLLSAVINVTEKDFARLKIGQETFVTVDFLTDKAFIGRIARIAPVFGENSRQARIEVDVVNKDKILKAGMFVRVHVELGRDENAVVVPKDALIQREGEYGIFVAENQKVHFIKVKTGIEQGNLVQVFGLEEGLEVVVLGHHLLNDGMTVVVNKS